jgi:uncharacterized membrane protein YeiH
MLEVLTYVATAAQAMTAALAAGRRQLDWFGVCVLACVTALGGGSARDIMLGHYPLSWVKSPNVLLLVCGAALFTIAAARLMGRLHWPFLILDAVGLVVFTIAGCNIGITMGVHPIIVIVAGMVTGIVGGILRDVLVTQVPLIFRGELYASVSIITAVVYYFGAETGWPNELEVVVALVLGLSLRLLSIHFGWKMPAFIYQDQDRR